MTDYLLELKDVQTHFPIYKGAVFEHRIGTIRAVDGVSLEMRPGEILGLVGESGCGKTTLARTILRMAPITSGQVIFAGQDLGALTPRQLRRLRPRMQMVFQDPYASLNPRMTVSDAIAEPMKVHRVVPRKAVARRVGELMERVGLAPRFMKKYPHEFSGGQRQRIAIARALALNPEFIIADEPVSALDVSVQAQILNLIAELCKSQNLTLMLISHDLAVVRHMSHRIAVMYLGKIVELGDAETVFNDPRHPYTQALLSAIPMPDPDAERARMKARLDGDPPLPIDLPSGCRFCARRPDARCPDSRPECQVDEPALMPCGPNHWVACVRRESSK